MLLRQCFLVSAEIEMASCVPAALLTFVSTYLVKCLSQPQMLLNYRLNLSTDTSLHDDVTLLWQPSQDVEPVRIDGCVTRSAATIGSRKGEWHADDELLQTRAIA